MNQTPRSPVTACVTQALARYFHDLDGAPAHDVYDLVLGEVERPLLEMVLAHTRGNQVQAAAILGINRNTLRARIKQYRLIYDEH